MAPRTFLFMLICAGIGYLMGRSRGMGLQGFFLGLAFGPLGWGLILLWPRTWVQGPMPRDASPGGGAFQPHRKHPDNRNRAHERTQDQVRDRAREAGKGCPRCGRPAENRAGVCPHCGNVLVPIRYQVDSGNSGNSP